MSAHGHSYSFWITDLMFQNLAILVQQLVILTGCFQARFLVPWINRLSSVCYPTFRNLICKQQLVFTFDILSSWLAVGCIRKTSLRLLWCINVYWFTDVVYLLMYDVYCFLLGMGRYVNCVLCMRRESRESFPRHHGLAIPICIRARASRTCRDVCRDR